MKNNLEIAKIFNETAELLDIKGVAFKPSAYRKAATALENLTEDLETLYKKEGLKGLEKIPGCGKSMAQKIEEYLQKNKIGYYDKLRDETAVRQIITHYFKTKGLSLAELKENARKKKIVYSRFTRPAKQLLELAGSLERAKQAMSKVAQWAQSRKLDYAIETVFKKWLELDRLKPKEVVKKPFYRNKPMVWSENYKKWYVIDDGGNWLEYADKEDKIEWRTIV